MPQPPTHRAIPAAILTAGVLTALAIVVAAVRGSAPPPTAHPFPGVPAGQFDVTTRTPNDPASPILTTP